MKYLIFLIFTTIAFASSGDGAGNGGLGYICENRAGEKVSVILDLAEDISLHKLNSQETTISMIAKDSDDLIKELDKYGWNANQKVIMLKKKIIENMKLFIDDNVDLNQEYLRDIFTFDELKKLKVSKNYFVYDSDITFYIHETPRSNYTNDSGPIKKSTLRNLKAYGFYNCRLAQVASTRKVSLYEYDKKIHLALYFSAIRYMDDANLKALMWHEIIYLALGGDDSRRTRKLVSLIMKYQI